MNALSRAPGNTDQILRFAWQELLRQELLRQVLLRGVDEAARRELDMAISPTPVRYDEALEVRRADEDETIDRIIPAMTHESEKVQAREPHAVRASPDRRP